MLSKANKQSARSTLMIALAVLLMLLTFQAIPSAKAAPAAMSPDQSLWYDTNGDEIWAQGGWMMKEDDTFLWYGMDYSVSGVKSINLFKSTDFVNWTKQTSTVPSGKGIVDFTTINPKLSDLEANYSPERRTIPFTESQWIGRPVVAYNNSTSQYVMIAEWNTFDKNYDVFGRNKLAFFTSASAEGPFVFQKYIARPNGYSMGDLGSIFTDDDGSTYLTMTVDKGDNWNGAFQLSKLTSDFMDIAVSTKHFDWTEGNKEATTLIKRGSQYYLFVSKTDGFRSTPSFYYTTTNLSGSWTYHWDLPTSPRSGQSFDTQVDQVFPIHGSEGTMYVYLGDRWSNAGFNGSKGTGRQGWFPLTFNGSGVPTVHDQSGWIIDVAAGTWTAVIPPEPELESFLSDDFEDGDALGWTANSGNWSIVTNGTYGYHQSNTTGGEAVATAGLANWSYYDVQADITPKSTTSGAATGIVGRYADNNNYYLLRLSANQVQLLRKLNGTFTTLVSNSYTVNVNTTYNLKLSMRGNKLIGSVNGVAELTAIDTSISYGKIGIRSYDQAAVIDNVQVDGVVLLEIIVDNNDPAPAFSTTGAWTASSYDAGFHHINYLHDGSAAADPGKFAAWTPTITQAGNYKIYMKWPASSNRPTAAPLEIQYGGLVDTSKTVNQTTNGNTWVEIGTYFLTASDTDNSVKLLASAPGYTIADAVKFVKQ